MELLYILLVLLLATRLFGEFSARFGQPVLVGELLAGACLGILVGTLDSYFPILSELEHNKVFEAITDLGIFFLMLLAGVEMRPRDMTRASGPALAVALGGMLLPMALGLAIGYLVLPKTDWKFPQMLYLGVALSVTAVPISVATLMELNRHRSRVGTIIVSAAVFDDLFSLFLLAVLTSVLKSGGGFEPSSLALLGGKMALFLVVTFVLGRWIYPWAGKLTRHLKVRHIEFSVLLILALSLAVFAELLGMHFILGAYAAGLFFTRETIEKVIHDDVHVQIEAITLGFLAPVFFASIGLSIDLTAIGAIPMLLVALIAAAFLGKLVGAGSVAYLSGMSRRDSLAIGIGMNARGAVELIIAGIALDAGLFSHPDPTPPEVANLFSAVVLMAICAAVFSPIGLRLLLPKMERNTSKR